MKTSIENVLLIVNLTTVAQKTLTHLPVIDRYPFQFEDDQGIEYIKKYILIEYDLREDQLEIHNIPETHDYVNARRGINVDVSLTVHFKDASDLNTYKLKHPKLYQKLKGDSWSTMFVNPDYIN